MNDSGIREISVSAKLDESGFSASAKSRTTTLIDELIGGTLDLVYQPLRRAVQRQQHKTELQKIELQDDLEHRMVVRLNRDERRKQQNREAVAQLTCEELLSLPAPAGQELDDTGEIDPDWLSMFGRFAENASSDKLRLLWGRIAAGEVRQVGSFSAYTLRIVSELDTETARKFEAVAKYQMDDKFIAMPIAVMQSQKLELSDLVEAGFLQQASPSFQAINHRSGNWSCILNGDLCLRVHLRQHISVPLVPLTRAGREIGRLLQKQPDDFVLRFIAANHITDDCLIELCRVKNSQGLEIECEPIEVLRRPKSESLF